MIHQLTYFSRCTFSTDESATHVHLDAILATSQPNNAHVGLTGFLIFDPPWFIQVLEGTHGEVEEALQRIERDTRHCDVRIIGTREIRNRSFPGWSMNGALRTPETDQIYLRHGLIQGVEPSHVKSTQILMLALDLQNYRGVAQAQENLLG